MDFRNFGLSYYEDKAINIILREKITAKKLSRAANIPPGKVYGVIKSLLNKGLIKVSSSRPKYLYIDNASKIIERLIEDKKSWDEKHYNELLKESALFTRQRLEDNSLIDIGYTNDDNLRIQSSVFNEAKHEVCQIFNKHHKPAINRKNKSIWEQEIEEAINRGVIFRCIYPKNTELPVHLSKLPYTKFLTQFKDIDYYRIDIVDDERIMIKMIYEDPLIFGGIIYLQDPKLARNAKKIFEDIWDKKYPHSHKRMM